MQRVIPFGAGTIISELSNKKIYLIVKSYDTGRRVCLGEGIIDKNLILAWFILNLSFFLSFFLEALARATLFTYFTTVLQHFSFLKCGGSENEKPAMLGFTLTPAPYSAKIIKRQ